MEKELEEKKESLNFIEQIIEEDNKSGKYNQRVHTRFPPEPNGYLHIGHAKSICLNFGLGKKYNGKTNLRFDDTNPVAEDVEYVDSIQEDVKWLGFQWENQPLYASDYFGKLYELAELLITKGKAYVDDSSQEEIRKMRGIPTEPGIESPYRNRTVAENLELFRAMRDGKYDEGTKVLRAKIDMASPNMHMRDPIIYRILKHRHHRTGDQWCVYPMYDYAHGLSDSIEGITHSICTLEFEVHRPLYDWLLIQLEVYRPQQIEFARLNLSYTIMSKRKLLRLVTEGKVNGWDDPRMSTISGMRRRGYTPESIRMFAEKVGIARRENIIELSLLEYCVREHLNKISERMMVVLEPLKVTLTNIPDDYRELLTLENNPEDPESGNRTIPFTNTLWIEQEDFMEDPPKKFFRLSPGSMVRLKGAYIIKCEEIFKDNSGQVIELKCSLVENSRSGNDTSGLKVSGTIHWVSAKDAIDVEVRMYDRLFSEPDPASNNDQDFLELLNPDSLTVITAAKAEPALINASLEKRYQFLRKGYFCLDRDSKDGALVFNRTVTLKDSWEKSQKG